MMRVVVVVVAASNVASNTQEGPASQLRHHDAVRQAQRAQHRGRGVADGCDLAPLVAHLVVGEDRDARDEGLRVDRGERPADDVDDALPARHRAPPQRVHVLRLHVRRARDLEPRVGRRLERPQRRPPRPHVPAAGDVDAAVHARRDRAVPEDGPRAGAGLEDDGAPPLGGEVEAVHVGERGELHAAAEDVERALAGDHRARVVAALVGLGRKAVHASSIIPSSAVT